MGEVLHRLLQTIRFQRDAFIWMDFNDRATGDALILILVTQVLLFIAAGASLFGLLGDLPGFVGALLQALIFWLVFAGIAYAAARFLFGGEGSYATFLRFTGFAYPTRLLLIAAVLLVPNDQVAFLLGSAWFLAIVAYGIHYVADLDLVKAGASSVLALAGWLIVSAIFAGGILF